MIVAPLTFTAEIASVTTTSKLDQAAARVLAFKVTLVGIVGDVSLDALKALQEEGELRVTLSLDGEAEHGGGAGGGGRGGVLPGEPDG